MLRERHYSAMTMGMLLVACLAAETTGSPIVTVTSAATSSPSAPARPPRLASVATQACHSARAALGEDAVFFLSHVGDDAADLVHHLLAPAGTDHAGRGLEPSALTNGDRLA